MPFGVPTPGVPWGEQDGRGEEEKGRLVLHLSHSDILSHTGEKGMGISAHGITREKNCGIGGGDDDNDYDGDDDMMVMVMVMIMTMVM